MQCNSHSHRDTSFLFKTEALFNVFFWPQTSTMHPFTVCTSDSVRWPVSCFAYDLTWWACQLVHAGDDSVSTKSVERLDMEKLRSEKVEGISALPRELCTRSPFLPLMMRLPTVTGIVVSIVQG